MPYRTERPWGGSSWHTTGHRVRRWCAVAVFGAGRAHWEAVKRVFRYLQDTKECNLTYGGATRRIVGFTPRMARHKNIGERFQAPSFLLTAVRFLVTVSTTKAKYVATTHAA